MLVLVHIVILLIVVLPFFLVGDLFDQFASELLSGGRSFEIFAGTALLLALDVFLPVPSSAVSISAGMLLGLPQAFTACFLGLTLGCFIGYGFGYFFRRQHFNRWYMDPEFRQLSADFSKYGYLVLLLCRGIPILAEMSVIVAGFHRYSLPRFLVLTTLGNLILAYLYSYVGEQAFHLPSLYLLIAMLMIITIATFSLRLWWLRQVAEKRALLGAERE